MTRKLLGATLLTATIALTACGAQHNGPVAPGTQVAPHAVGDHTRYGTDKTASRPTVQLNVPKVKAPFHKTLTVNGVNGTVTRLAVKAAYRNSSTEKRPTRLYGSLVNGLWTSNETMEPNATYTVTATLKDNAGALTTLPSFTVTTKDLPLSKQTYATLNVHQGATYGVGMPIKVSFDVPVKDKAAFEKNMVVTPSPAQAGSWYWESDTVADWRPKHYWKAHTRVEVDLNLNSLSAGNGVYGQSAKEVFFKIGDAHIFAADADKHQMRILKNGKVIRTVPISAGQPGFETRTGTKVVSDKMAVHQMKSCSVGICNPASSNHYDLTVYWDLRVTNSGEFIHSAPWSDASHGVANVSHGCIGLSSSDAEWLYHFAQIGDVNTVIGTSHKWQPYGDLQNGYGDWNLTWKQWQKGSALR